MPYDRSAFVTRTPTEGVCFDFMSNADMYIADKLFTPKAVSKKETKIYQADTSKLRVMETRKKTNQEVDLVDEQLFKKDITLEEHKLGAEINPVDERDADVPAMLSVARKARVVTNHILLQREQLAATLATTVGNYPSDLTSALSTGSKWNENGGDPEGDMVTAANAMIKRCGRGPNALAIDVTTFNKLRTSPSFRDRVKYTGFMGGPIVTEEAMKAFFNVEHLFVGKAQRDSAVEGAAVSIDGFWSTNAIFFVYNPSVALEDISFGHMYLMKAPFWTKTTVDERRNGAAGSMKRVEVGSEYKLGPGYTVGSGDDDFAAGYLFRTVVA